MPPVFLIGYLLGRPEQDYSRTRVFVSGDRNASVPLLIARQVCNDLKVLVIVRSTVVLLSLILWPAALWFGRRTGRRAG